MHAVREGAVHALRAGERVLDPELADLHGHEVAPGKAVGPATRHVARGPAAHASSRIRCPVAPGVCGPRVRGPGPPALPLAAAVLAHGQGHRGGNACWDVRRGPARRGVGGGPARGPLHGRHGPAVQASAARRRVLVRRHPVGADLHGVPELQAQLREAVGHGAGVTLLAAGGVVHPEGAELLRHRLGRELPRPLQRARADRGRGGGLQLALRRLRAGLLLLGRLLRHLRLRALRPARLRQRRLQRPLLQLLRRRAGRLREGGRGGLGV
mmetsp:Transcript_81846/g.240264  ORF Transcript_81846/g.240264 Transcript_81846/m.240264 type:complete len:269 (+) Transcript_81846:316-1122(+)